MTDQIVDTTDRPSSAEDAETVEAAEAAETTDAAVAGVEVPAEPSRQIEVRRNVVLSGAVGGLAGILAVAFAVRAFGGGTTTDWAALVVLGVIAVLHAAAVVDARAPLLVADPKGVRLRNGAEWQGMAWDQIECLEHLPRHLPFRDGHLLVVGETGRQLIVPLTLATRVVGSDGAGLSDELAALADGRADVVEVVPGFEEESDLVDADAPEPRGEEAVAPPATVPAIPPLPKDAALLVRHGIAAEVERRFRSPVHGDPSGLGATDETDTVDTLDPILDDASTDEIEAVEDAPEPPEPGRPTMAAARVEVQHTGSVRTNAHGGADAGTGSHPTIGANALRLEPTASPASDRGVAEQTLTVVLDDFDLQPAPDPVIGPQLEAARERLRLTIDQLADRTRIRPHVIEAIEVDDFGPCGGDFYARGHLRTLARVLGIDAAPLVATYDETYADAPVDPRRVFESELATGVGGSIRGTRGGRNWSVLLAAVMAAVLVWSIARLVMDGPVPLGEPASLRQTGSGGISNGQQNVPVVPVVLTATGGGAAVLVRDGRGDIVFDGKLAFGQTSELKVIPPVRIQSSDGSVTAAVDCKDAVALGDTGAEVTKVLSAC